MFIYMVFNQLNGKYYIGKTVEKNLVQYWWNQKCLIFKKVGARTSKPSLYGAVRKYGWDHFAIYPLISNLTTNDELVHWEKVLIKALKSQHPQVGYNICDGGEGVPGRPCSPETRAKIGAANAITARGNHNKLGKYLSEESREKMKGNKNCLGRKYSDETLAKMRASATGRIISPEQRAKISTANKGKPWSAARRAAQTV